MSLQVFKSNFIQNRGHIKFLLPSSEFGNCRLTKIYFLKPFAWRSRHYPVFQGNRFYLFTKVHFYSVGVPAFPLIPVALPGCSKLSFLEGETLKNISIKISLWVEEGGTVNASSEGKAAM